MLHSRLIHLLLVSFTQMLPTTSYEIPEGLYRVLIKPMMDHAVESRKPCSMAVTCEQGGNPSHVTVDDHTGVRGPPGKTGHPGAPGDEGFSGLSGRSGEPERRCKVAFNAILQDKYYSSVGRNVPLIFDKVVSNVGGAYKAKSGLFIAPDHGLYRFHVSVGARIGRIGAVTINHNGRFQGTVWADSQNGNGFASNDYVFEMRAGDSMGLLVVKRVPYVRDEGYTTFSGRCLQKI